MDPQAPLQLPTIDFSEITKQIRGTPAWNSTKTQVFKALEEFGCFEASFNGISSDLRNSMFASIKELFDLPFETKVKNLSPKIYNGYIGQGEGIPIFESMGIEELESFVNLMWPHGNLEFSTNLRSYSEKFVEVDEIIRSMVLESLNLEKYVEEHMELTSNLVRVMKYRTPKEDGSKLGLPSHKDKSMLSILHQNEVQGLEVQYKDENWFKVKFSENSYIVIVGETFRVWTNGRLHSPTHRVVVSGDEDRYSFGFFTFGKLEKTIKSPEELVDDEHPLLFRPYKQGEFISFFNTKGNSRIALEEFCGV